LLNQSFDRLESFLFPIDDILCEMASHPEHACLEEHVLAAVAPIGLWFLEVVVTVYLNRDLQFHARQVDLCRPRTEVEWQCGVEPEEASGQGLRLEQLEDEAFGKAARPLDGFFGITGSF
jgi:hypothetical protein